MKTSINLAPFNCWARCVRGSLSGRKEEGSWASLSQDYRRLGGQWSVVSSSCLPMQSFLPQVAVEVELARF